MAQELILQNGAVYNDAETGNEIVVDGVVFNETAAAAPSAWTGIINGVTNPSRINGILVANIAKVNGIA